MNRTFLLPLSALALGVTGCTVTTDTGDDPDTGTDTDAGTEADTEADTEAAPTLVGEWSGTSFTDYAAETYALPRVESYTDYGITYTNTFTIGLSVTTGGVTLSANYTYTEEDGGNVSTDSDVQTYSGSWSEGAANVYALDLEGESLDMSCTLSGDSLECTATETDPDVQSISFARDAE